MLQFFVTCLLIQLFFPSDQAGTMYSIAFSAALPRIISADKRINLHSSRECPVRAPVKLSVSLK